MSTKNEKRKIKEKNGSGKGKQIESNKIYKITMKDIEAMSSDSEGEVPPEEAWGDDAKALKRAIEKGEFDKLLTTNRDDDDDDNQSIEEADLSEEDEDQEDNVDNNSMNEEELSEEQQEDEEEEEEEAADNTQMLNDDAENDSDDNLHDKSKIDSGETYREDSEDSNNEISRNDVEVVNDETVLSDQDSIDQAIDVNTKAMKFVTETLRSEKRGWPWAETFDVVVKTPLPFGKVLGQEGNAVSVHDDLKREVAFYDIALEAVLEAKKKIAEASIPFSRPDDFFAEMVKSDEHMARVKDRLIFETKKMDAVAQRKASKEQKLRSKEAVSNKVAEKAKRKKEHFKQLEEWAQTAASNRGRGKVLDNDNGFLSSSQRPAQKGKKRELADKKYGFGGKRGRFKQNDPKDLNDFSSFNPRGNFPGIGTKGSKVKKNGAGSARKGKRARDASRGRS